MTNRVDLESADGSYISVDYPVAVSGRVRTFPLLSRLSADRRSVI